MPLFYCASIRVASGISQSCSLKTKVYLIKFVRNILWIEKKHIKEKAEVFEIMKQQKVDIYIRKNQGYKVKYKARKKGR